ncbi:MAG: excinuclease ABC subunit UvrA [Piscirickettsiaceae bacterium CG_4_9_14_3_um_filter_43_564]|nr:excinuclease ABC subunit UvrA [Thiomicrospira sp.]PIQ06102.1 MAG: excinuclease ABC subunit A [Piscirickettsiaceae bacterium CG18_big_fil_WC_8_21_14_2_50_44_103]PIU38365.1 MAG: excinuclease ABC subunit UvrA [Piscirickettsiaceae bacterium CG07_land_8_20_14_0_80_44_28]PIW58209.1 MAG: excinuclease ABC subunit UvrA [Piscirickettsiaceae bacterium CG12_big_fil_rev_8_21_14_0_65_44_934]PIW76758.1 MAG: excinuclease ABC subunit UvrA [Piscirickettsiaceae bacterium CG_4_8_14_3_um_filter_44_38]PIX79005.1
MLEEIIVRGARTHNLKNIDVTLPRDKLIVITGLSGSGKSSLAFDTIYAEGQRRYVESLSAYARQFLSVMEKPDIDHIEGLSPAISIEQKSTSHNPRSTVGTVTEIYDYLRLLYARAGTPRCPTHHCDLVAQTVSQMVDHTLTLPENSKCLLVAPVVRGKKGSHQNLLDELQAQGYLRARIDGKLMELDGSISLNKNLKHDIEVVVDRFKIREDIKQRLAESFETALHLAEGIALVLPMETDDDFRLVFSERFSCPHCGYSVPELEPRIFSFNNPHGACPSCDGLGVKQTFDANKIVIHPELSLAGGAIRGWDRRHKYYYDLLKAVADHYQFDMETSWQDLPLQQQEIILYGSGKEKLPLPHGRYADRRRFEGVIPNMERRLLETESKSVRDELEKFRVSLLCHSCHGTRLNESARHFFVAEKNLPELTERPIGELHTFFHQLKLDGSKGKIAEKIIKEVHSRLSFLVNVGLNYLNLNRSADTLSGGEAQRIRLASQIGAGLVGVMYVLDEPSIGLHQRDNDRLLNTLNHLRDLGNTVIVVEHDEDAIRAADYVLDIGPGAGIHGGHVIAQGSPEQVMKNPESLTGQYLTGKKAITVPTERLPLPQNWLNIEGASGNNLQAVNLAIPAGLLTCITGVSGSGKSTLINDTLYKIAATALNKAQLEPAPYQTVKGLEHFDKVVNIDQSPIGRTPRSNPATYTGLFTPIRELLSATPESRTRGYTPGRFSFNVKGGRCEACQGDGVIKVEMHFLPDVYVACDVCNGQRYNRETLQVHYKGKNIHDILEMTVEDARAFFDAIPVLSRKLTMLIEVGLGYIKLGQSATTLSGGEAQRVKLAKELSKRDTGNTLYILDEPTTGLHFHDIELLLKVIRNLRDHGNTIVIIEHNLDVIKTADWVIDLGPEGGSGGGQIIATGTPEMIAEEDASYTGHYLKKLLTKKPLIQA